MAPLLEVRDLSTHFFLEEGLLRAVDGVSFCIDEGRTMGLVGESGCGKTVLALSLMGLVDPPGRVVGGQVLLEGRDLGALRESERRKTRGAGIAMVFQEPAAALNPVLTIGKQVSEAVLAHRDVPRSEAWDLAVRALEEAAVPDAPRRAREYPHQLSGGLRQRAMIAMALAAGPRVLVADEPTTALDVTIQAQILELLRALGERLGLAVLLITHDLGVVGETCDEVAVMYAGSLVETGPTGPTLGRPLHPYTRALLASHPSLDADRRGGPLPAIPGAVPDLTRLDERCRFADRCPERFDRCDGERPGLLETEPGRAVACYLHGSDGPA
jgi:oligopeptide/dipeptide ABC transporter ATP-binding protein